MHVNQTGLLTITVRIFIDPPANPAGGSLYVSTFDVNNMDQTYYKSTLKIQNNHSRLW